MKMGKKQEKPGRNTMDKKAISLAMNTIVIAVMALVVLVVLIAIFTGRVNLFGQQTETCYSKGGECSDQGECAQGTIKMYTKDCTFYPETQETEGRLGQCCVKI